MMATAAHKRVSLANLRLNLDSLIEVFAFLSVLLIGADTWGVSALGVNFRLDQLFLLAFVLLLAVKDQYRITRNGWIVAFAFLSFISTVLAFNFTRSILFFFSILFNIFFLFYGIASYIGVYGLRHFISLWRKTCYVQFGVMLMQFLLKVLFDYELPFLPSYGVIHGVPRFQLWFYEPSYLATYLSLWFAVSLYMLVLENRSGYFPDVILALWMFIMSTSTTGFVAIAFVALLVWLLWLAKGITLRKLLFIPLALVVFIVFRILFSDLYDTFVARLFNSSLDSASGGRISNWTETWEVFLENPFFGVGAGNYGLYLGRTTQDAPTNVTLELMATLGVFCTFAFYGLSFSLCRKCFRLHRMSRSETAGLLCACAVALIVFTVVLQVNQGYLRLYHWMFFGVLWGGIRQEERALRARVPKK